MKEYLFVIGLAFAVFVNGLFLLYEKEKEAETLHAINMVDDINR